MPPAVDFRIGDDSARQQLCAEGLPPLAARILSARGVTSSADALPSLSSLPSPASLPGMESLAEALARAVRNGEKICIVGDGDADGVSACAIATDALEKMGAQTFWRIPYRFHERGLQPEDVEWAKEQGAHALLTVDNGASAADAARRAEEMRLPLFVTDHHLPPEEPLPAAYVVNPLLSPDGAGAHLTGAGVAFFVMNAVRDCLDGALPMDQYLDLVALGAVADRARMDRVNRALTSGGLARIRSGDARPGLAALCPPGASANTTCSEISRVIAPRINAACRFGRPEAAVRCMLARSQDEASTAASELEGLNVQRLGAEKKAMRGIPEGPLARALDDSVIVVWDESWHPGIVSRIADRLSEKHGRPAFALACRDGIWGGSGRAPGDWDLHALVKRAAESMPEDIARFGGHPRAVGISTRNPDRLTQRLLAEAEAFAPSSGPAPATVWKADETPPAEEITSDGVSALGRMAWGDGFPSPQFYGEFHLPKVRSMRNGGSRTRLAGGPWNLEAISSDRPPSEQSAALFHLSSDRYGDGIIAFVSKWAPMP